MSCGADKRFLALGEEIPKAFPVPPQFSFVSVKVVAGMAWVSGHGPNRIKAPPEFDYVGQIGRELSLADGVAAARLAGLNMLVSLRRALGSLDVVQNILRCDCMVSSAPEFDLQSVVANGCTDLLRDVFREKGLASRTAMGTQSLPFGMAVETSLVAYLDI